MESAELDRGWGRRKEQGGADEEKGVRKADGGEDPPSRGEG